MSASTDQVLFRFRPPPDQGSDTSIHWSKSTVLASTRLGSANIYYITMYTTFSSIINNHYINSSTLSIPVPLFISGTSTLYNTSARDILSHPNIRNPLVGGNNFSSLIPDHLKLCMHRRSPQSGTKLASIIGIRHSLVFTP